MDVPAAAGYRRFRRRRVGVPPKIGWPFGDGLFLSPPGG
jgi:hypothetical protein